MVGVAGDQLLDLKLRALEARHALAVELLAATEQRDRVVDRHVAALEPRHDLFELPLQVFERPLLASLASDSSRRAEPGSALA